MRQHQSWEDRAEASTANYKGTPRSCSGFSCLSLHQEDLFLSQPPSFLLFSLFSLPSCTHLLPPSPLYSHLAHRQSGCVLTLLPVRGNPSTRKGLPTVASSRTQG